MRFRVASALPAGLAITLAVSAPALADDQPFQTIVTTDIQPQGGREFEQWLTWKSGHANEAFNEFELRSEVEYGITDDIEGSLYLIYDWEHTRPHSPFGPTESDSTLGLAGELIYRFWNPYFDPIGFAIYLEPTIGTHERSFETKFLFQKNFFNSRLRTVLNINLEDTWEHNPAGNWDQASALEFDFGAAYNVTPDLSLGLEFDNERGFEGEVLGWGARPASDSFYLGPTVQYITVPWTITLGAQTQLPIATDPTHTPGNVLNGQTAADEHFRAILRISRDF